jgi:pimeloyl-ACP methyl ester carboxylesterase
MQNPVIVIPGITGTSLHDEYPLENDAVWSILHKSYERVALHPENLRYEALEPARVRAGKLLLVYSDLILALRHELSVRGDCPTPVFAFPYDWRTDIRQAAEQLALFVDEVRGRTRLLRHYASAGADLRVDLVGHSMGGLVIAEYLTLSKTDAHVGKIATIGTPFEGSLEAVVKIATGMGILSGTRPSEREREPARLTPSLYQLFPTYEGAAVDQDNVNVDLLDHHNMQMSVLESIVEFVRLYSTRESKSERSKLAEKLLHELLTGGERRRDMVRGLDLAAAGVAPENWLAIVGVGEKTRLQLTVAAAAAGRRFVIGDDQFANELSKRRPTRRRTGDGTVPFDGAIPPFLPLGSLVCVTDRDAGIFEVADRLAESIVGLHATMPMMGLVQRLVIRHLRPDFRGKVWGRHAPGVTAWRPPIEQLKDIGYKDL